METVVRLEGVSKLYKLYSKPLDRFKELLGLGKRHKEFWALKDISLDVRKGETVGVIGLNGSGKSTLLQIIAGTTKPSTGVVEVNGRRAALLELGIGFHPEFTGRENIRMSASLMGVDLTPSLEREIIDFAEIGEFIDQPVKSYSSGMFVRLAFSLAVMVDPDILIIDEALSVGDYHFQKKSFNKIMEFKNRGKTLIFCSHSMYHVNHLCERAIWLHKGQVRMDGPADLVTAEYEDFVRSMEKKEASAVGYVTGESAKGVKFKLELSGKEPYIYKSGDLFEAKVVFESEVEPCHVSFGISRNDGLIVYATSTQMDGLKPLASGSTVVWRVEKLPLLQGLYELHAVLLDDTGNVVLSRKVKRFKVLPKEGSEEIGVVRLPYRWSFQ